MVASTTIFGFEREYREKERDAAEIFGDEKVRNWRFAANAALSALGFISAYDARRSADKFALAKYE